MRRLPPLGALRAFEAAARRLSFKDAADELGLTPTAISHQVRLLEAHCGAKLFRRRPRPLALTEAGAKLLPGVRDGFDALARAVGALGVEPDPLRVTATGAFVSRWLTPRLAGWREAHPDIGLSVIGADRVLSLDNGEADLAIRYARAAPPGAEAEIFRDRYFPVCGPALVRPGGAPLAPAALARLPLIRFDWFAKDPTAPDWDAWFDAASGGDDAPRRPLPIALRYREEAHAIEAALTGQGVALCGDIVVADDLAAGRLVRASDIALPGYGFYPVFRAKDPRRPLIEAFVAWLRKTAAGPASPGAGQKGVR